MGQLENANISLKGKIKLDKMHKWINISNMLSGLFCGGYDNLKLTHLTGK